MTRSGFALLLGWLTEGVGGEAPGAGDGFFGEKGRRGRAAVMRVVNNHLRFDGKHRLHDAVYWIDLDSWQWPRPVPPNPLRLGRAARVSSLRAYLNPMERLPHLQIPRHSTTLQEN
jgi:hypothetical protein